MSESIQKIYSLFRKNAIKESREDKTLKLCNIRFG